MINYWWVTRPKRRLNSIPDLLAVYATVFVSHPWSGNREIHLQLEEALEEAGLKRKGTRRDRTGGGARTYTAWLKSLGLLFEQNETKQLRFTLAGEAILNGENPGKILTNQVLKYQFPSSFSIGRGVQLNDRFKIHPFWFLLKLLTDSRLKHYLTQEEIAKIVITEAENEKDKTYERIVDRIIQFRSYGDACLDSDFIWKYKSSKGKPNPNKPFDHLEDVANTILNWLEYTQLIYREKGTVSLLDETMTRAKEIVAEPLPFIDRPADEEYFQRKYGLDPAHRKDTRDLTQSDTVTARVIMEHQIKQAFVSLSLQQPIYQVNPDIITKIAEKTAINEKDVEEILQKDYPHGAIGAFMSSYFEMAFKGREECRDLEIATAQIFKDVFKFDARHIAGGSKEVPDVLLLSNQAGYQAIIDTKAYSRYDLGAAQRDRMIHHYVPDIKKYGSETLPLAFFTYISGGFTPTINTPLQKVIQESGAHGSACTVTTIIKMVEESQKKPYTHQEIRSIFSLDRKIEAADILRG